MFDDHDLSTVPDVSMLSLSRSLVAFLTTQSRRRGWVDVTQSLCAVEAVLARRANAQAPKSRAG